jgi:hypothetical protein
MSACKYPDVIVPSGTSREEVYRLMGTPSNGDDRFIAVWHDSLKSSSIEWREIYGSLDPRVTVFDESGISLLPTYPASANFELDAEMDDEFIMKSVELDHKFHP